MIKKISLYIAGIIFVLALVGIFRASNTVFKEEIPLVNSIENFHFVSPGIMRGSQPDRTGFEALKTYCGLKTDLDLCLTGDNVAWEKALVEHMGIKFINIPLSGSQILSPEEIESIVGQVYSIENRPIFVHCFAGKDRTGVVMAAYRIKYEGWSYKDALLEMLAYGFNRVGCANLEKSLQRWYEWRKGGGS